MERRRRFHGHDSELAELTATFLAPELDLVAGRGGRCMDKTCLLREAVPGLPDDRSVVWHSACSCNTPE